MKLTREINVYLLSTVLCIITGCVKQGVVKESFEPAKPEPIKLGHKFTGAIYQEGMNVGFYEDTTAHYVGDILTIRLLEKATATAHSSTKAEKAQNIEMPPPKLAGDAVKKDDKEVLNNQVNAGRDFKGSGASDQSHSFDGMITVTVAEVLPNKHLVVRGEKLIVLNQSDEFIRFSGIVRPQDIDQSNSVDSNKIANVRISYAGEGVLSSANSMGPLARFFQGNAYPY
ncbi:MAG: flagellar basal body L-ring protein FlgH [Gammaproteobacteria bacterium]|nr:flagellar basal body L-ring protein FlgH [Gammaproteobacteria bacterium]